MATVTEYKYGSREGTTWSQSAPSSSVGRMFKVVVDDQNDDPIVTLRTIRPEGTNAVLVNEGSPHPWYPDLFARDYTIHGRINNVTWTVGVVYAQTQLPVGTWFGWTPHTYTASEMIRRYDSLPVFPWDKYPPVDSTTTLIYAWGHLHGNVKRVASHKYEVLAPDDTTPNTHWAYNSEGVAVKLRQTKLRYEADAGFDYPLPIAVLTLDKDVLSVPSNYAMLMLYFKQRVCSQVFLPQLMNIPMGHSRFEHGDVSIVDGSLPGAPMISTHYHVQLVFTISSIPLSFMRKTHYWEHDGAISPVFDAESNRLQHEDFKVADQTDLNYLLTRFV